MDMFCMLGSGSQGNCGYLRQGDTALLLDAGISCRRILSSIRQLGEKPEKLRGIFITHEHSDHISGLKTLTKQLDIPVYAAPPVAEFLRHNQLVSRPQMVREITGTLSLGEISLTPFPTSHDSIHCLGYRLEFPQGDCLGYATDLGTVDEAALKHLLGCRTVVLESNYDEGMLQVGPYPYALKRRILSPKGHLSNEECSNTLVKLVSQGAKQLVLAHLSQENNLPELAYSFAQGTLAMAGIGPECYSLSIAPPGCASPLWGASPLGKEALSL